MLAVSVRVMELHSDGIVIRSHLRHPNGQRRDSALFSLLPGELP